MKHKILIVDDLSIARLGASMTMNVLGYTCDQAESGQEALEKVTRSQYSAILMDFNMPGMDGLQCTRKIRELEKGTGTRTPIIGLTSSTSTDIRELCLKAGMDDYLDKGCDMAELKLLVSKWVVVANDI